MLRFVGKRRPEKIRRKSPPLFNAKFPGKYRKNMHKKLLERRQSKNVLQDWLQLFWELSRASHGVSRPGGQGQMFMHSERKEHLILLLGCLAGRISTRVTGQKVCALNVYVPPWS